MTGQPSTSVDVTFLTDVLEESAARLRVVGAQLALWDGRELMEAATGLANRETNSLVSTATVFQIGSTTKLFAAALTMQLVDEGRVDLDEPVISYLPDFRLADEAATRTTTLRHLHSMTSGMDNGPYTDYGRGDDTIARYVAAYRRAADRTTRRDVRLQQRLDHDAAGHNLTQ